MNIKDLGTKIVKEKLTKENLKPNTTKKKVLLGVLVLLLGALGLEISNNDFDLGSIMQGNSVADSKIERDANGNLVQNEAGDFVTRIMRDINGDPVATGTVGGKYTDEYNCDDFKNQPQAQKFFAKAGGPSKDVNGLDGDNDGEACESLPKK
ncbi:MAG TPA: excalibur calcium-binding domain-containing protein [Candidatus Paceibacterota bacterium]|nr:excalibur calcium-binding domain-containing protein [Candidatus Paceibacterota bacterium]